MCRTTRHSGLQVAVPTAQQASATGCATKMFNDRDEYFVRLERVAARKRREKVEKDAAHARQVANDKKKKDKKAKAKQDKDKKAHAAAFAASELAAARRQLAAIANKERKAKRKPVSKRASKRSAAAPRRGGKRAATGGGKRPTKPARASAPARAGSLPANRGKAAAAAEQRKHAAAAAAAAAAAGAAAAAADDDHRLAPEPAAVPAEPRGPPNRRRGDALAKTEAKAVLVRPPTRVFALRTRVPTATMPPLRAWARSHRSQRRRWT
jgi:hypothetical protein